MKRNQGRTLTASVRRDWRKNWQLHLLLWPGLILLIIFKFIPMGGIVMAFKDYVPRKGIFGSEWVGMENFSYMFSLPNTWQVLWNTLRIAIEKIVVNFPIPILIALMLNEIQNIRLKKTVQTIIYLPYFISWVIIAGIVQDLFTEEGMVNQMIQGLGMQPVFFMGESGAFEAMLVGTDVWKNFGYGTVVYLAAITGVDESLFDAAKIDGASRIKQIWYITLPSIAPIVMLMLILSLGNVMNAGFEQIFNLYNPLVYDSADIIDTFVYRVSLVEANYSLGTAVGLLKSVASFILIVSSYAIANKYTDYTVF